MDDMFAREGDAPLRRLAAALEQQQQQQQPQQLQEAGAGSEAVSETVAALQSALKGVVWTRSMRRLYTLLDRCLQHREPVLLVGETGGQAAWALFAATCCLLLVLCRLSTCASPPAICACACTHALMASAYTLLPMLL